MHQGLEDEKGMAPAHAALDKAPGHTTDSTLGRGSSWSPAMSHGRLWGGCLRCIGVQRVCGSLLPGPGGCDGSTSNVIVCRDVSVSSEYDIRGEKLGDSRATGVHSTRRACPCGAGSSISHIACLQASVCVRRRRDKARDADQQQDAGPRQSWCRRHPPRRVSAPSKTKRAEAKLRKTSLRHHPPHADRPDRASKTRWQVLTEVSLARGLARELPPCRFEQPTVTLIRLPAVRAPTSLRHTPYHRR